MDKKDKPATDDHPSHDVYQGQLFVKEVYETLRSSPQWNETLFIITYDEHGGFFDHVPTPVKGVPSPDGIVGPEPFFFTFDRLGVRVPTIMVSPWIEKGTVSNGRFIAPQSLIPECIPLDVPRTMSFMGSMLASVLNGDHLLTGFQEKVLKHMNVKEGIAYADSAVKHFFEAGLTAKKMGIVDDEQIVEMRPSLTSRSSSSSVYHHP
ncbi:hypothetical protein BHE74_00054553 [Ensete ventricosum]|nr:hypothetical protein GW17_00015659 [Ensete ventricosum]RWW40059.1 hypothetical protein BHE74_00054553 [Ensete ventricosum]RZS26053.1 hypothetical protein BHM03_00059341 [Ensete ventricosum]